MTDRSAKIAKILLEWRGELGPMEDWCDEEWEWVEEGVSGVYFEEWRDLLDWEESCQQG